MKKKIIIPFLIFTLLCLGLCGCTQEETTQPEDKSSPDDLDGDGYPNDIDDFPNDKNLHEIAEFNIDNPINTNITVQHGSNSVYSNPNITSDWKYIILKWEVTSPILTEEQQKKVYVEVMNPAMSTKFEQYYYNNTNNRNLSFTVTNKNSGYWGFNFLNLVSLNVSLEINYELYKIK